MGHVSLHEASEVFLRPPVVGTIRFGLGLKAGKTLITIRLIRL